VLRIEALGVDVLLRTVAGRDLADALEATPADHAAAHAAWQARWSGLRSWFIGGPGAPAQAEVLRARARASIPALLLAVASLHDRRVTRSDRTADLRALARWFADADSDPAAHRLWRAAFALTPARHLLIDAATLEQREARPVPSPTSWLTAPPLHISPRLRAAGRYIRRGRPNDVVDRSSEKALLVEAAAAEAAQIAAARRRLASGARARLSDLGALDATEFSLFLDLLGEALSIKVGRDEAVEVVSSDGTMHVTLEPSNDDVTATIVTPTGRFSGPDHYVTIRDLVPRGDGTRLRDGATVSDGRTVDDEVAADGHEVAADGHEVAADGHEVAAGGTAMHRDGGQRGGAGERAPAVSRRATSG
jgi:uncharacterized protein (TIGR02677 family)